MEEDQQGFRKRIADIESRNAITDLIHTYARNIRLGKGADNVHLFIETGVFEIRDAPLDLADKPVTRSILVGHDQIHKYLTHGDASLIKLCPTIQNIIIELNSDSAVTHSVMTNTIWPGGKRLIGEYEDHFVFEQKWLFASRRFDILGTFD